MSTVRIQLLPYQAALIQSKRPYLALIGGTGSGKTWFLPRWLLHRMAQYPGQKWIVSSPTYSTLKREPWEMSIQLFREVGLHIQVHNGAMIVDVMDFRARIYFISAENPDRMQGTHAKGVIGDEAGLYSELWWNTAIQRVGRHRGQVLLLTTPYSATGWLKTRVLEPWKAGDPKFHVERPRTSDNPYYPREEIERARETLPPWRFRMMYEGEFVRPEGLVYPEPAYCAPFTIPDTWRRMRGLDFGYQNPTAIVWLAEDPKAKTWYVYHEVKASELVVDDIAKILSDPAVCKGNKKTALTYADPAGKGLIEDLKRRGINVRSAANEVLPGIMSVTEAFQRKRLQIFDNLRYLRDELGDYRWKRDRTGSQVDAPVKENDHLLDALRYAWYTSRAGVGLGSVETLGWSMAR